MNYFFRLNRASQQPQVGSPTGILTEISQTPWSKVEEGDGLVLLSGSGLDTEFIATARIVAVAIQDASREETGPFEHTFKLEGIKWLEGREVDTLRYSLKRVANLSQPSRNIRHHGLVEDVDVITIEEGRVATLRSLYFGLLSKLPPGWRDALEARAQSDQLAELIGVPIKKRSARPLPFAQLADLVELSAITPAMLAADIADMASRLLFGDRVGSSVDLVFDEIAPPVRIENIARMNSLSQFQQNTSSGADAQRRLQGARAQAESGPAEFEREVTWRPHHW